MAGARAATDVTSSARRLTLLQQSRPPRFAIDLRSEVMVPPTEEMWDAMRRSSTSVEWPFGDGDDYIEALEDECAKLMGQEAALFLPTTSMANLVGILSLSSPGQHVILGSASHVYCFERQNICSVGGRVPRLVAENRFGELPLEQIEAALRSGAYDARPDVAVIALENTHNVSGGTRLRPDYVESVSRLARENGARLFVDGARLMNSAVAQAVPLEALAGAADGVSMSLNKG